ncbi:hypothetical protein [Singulisphaera acidiphila]|uniref:hypothetical protein n=1 Tax=Singulisphaera acidiphila TaxID=466153 RepID=UPI0003756FE9|nr:hypothetical protein [Singulisphaera acidiphila]
MDFGDCFVFEVAVHALETLKNKEFERPKDKSLVFRFPTPVNGYGYGMLVLERLLGRYPGRIEEMPRGSDGSPEKARFRAGRLVQPRTDRRLTEQRFKELDANG